MKNIESLQPGDFGGIGVGAVHRISHAAGEEGAGFVGGGAERFLLAGTSGLGALGTAVPGHADFYAILAEAEHTVGQQPDEGQNGDDADEDSGGAAHTSLGFFEEVAHLAEAFVALIDQLFGRERLEFGDGGDQGLLEEVGGFVVVFLRAAGGLWDDSVDRGRSRLRSPAVILSATAAASPLLASR